MNWIRLFIILTFLFSHGVAIADPIAKDEAIKLVTERLDKLERFVFLYSVSRDESADHEYTELKKLVLSGRNEIAISKKGDFTLKVYEEFYWFKNTQYPRHAPTHSLGFTDGKTSYSWLSEGNSTNTATPPNSYHTHGGMSINLLVDTWLINPISFILQNLDEINSNQEVNFTANLDGDQLSIQLENLWKQNVEFIFDTNKGLKSVIHKRPGSEDKSEIIIDTFQQVKEDIWVPKSGRMISQSEGNRIETKIEVLKVKVNEDINPVLFKNFPWDDPKYNTKFGLKWEGENQRRTNRIQFKDHPPSYFSSFFGMSLDEAYQMYLQID